MIVLSIDGGATRTRGVLFTENGEVRLYRETEATSLSRPDADASQLLGAFIEELPVEVGFSLPDVGIVGVGVAGVSNLDARERLFKELDRLGLSDRVLVTSDVEAAYEAVWGDAPGVLVCVGTGTIAWARDVAGNTFRASGRGPQAGGDPGSGYWMGKTAMIHLIMNEQSGEQDLVTLRGKVMEIYGAETFEEAARMAGEVGDQLSTVARMGRVICELAEEGNDVALAIVQEGTQSLGEEVLQLVDKAELRREELTVGIHGSIISRSAIFRRMLTSAMVYDIPKITWRPPVIDPVFGAGLIGARLHQIPIDLDALIESWGAYHLQTEG